MQPSKLRSSCFSSVYSASTTSSPPLWRPEPDGGAPAPPASPALCAL